ncbi:carboxypeptidase regulatory-like domain-containing protein [Aromatoleum sp.]|uniref:carboxypeptidase regulatory-like domain-containing protein n=1 Tax=Aromatoleum sp. TaxID=2307007 RepID=UPI002FC631F8
MKRHVLVAGLVAVAALISDGTAFAQSAMPPSTDVPAPAVREFEGVRYVTGGVGEDERAALRGIARDFNLKLTFAEKSGDYLSGVKIVITRRDGRKVLELDSEGPLVLAKLPPGGYRISATANGREQTRHANVAGTGQRSLSFYW